MKKITNPQMTDVLDHFGYNLSRSINCMLIGKILKYDSATNTCEVEVGLKRKLSDGTEMEFPPLVDCPVIYLGGGGSFLSFPIAKGDPCCVFFCDRSIDEWWLSGTAKAPSENRAHSLSDGIVLVGPRSQTGLLTVDDAVTLNAALHKIRIRNQTQSLKLILNAMLDAIVGALGTVAVAGVTPGSGAATGTCVITSDPNIATVKALIAQLFEE